MKEYNGFNVPMFLIYFLSLIIIETIFLTYMVQTIELWQVLLIGVLSLGGGIIGGSGSEWQH